MKETVHRLNIIIIHLMVVVCILLLYLPAPVSAAGATMSIVPSAETVDVGDTFTVDVVIDTGSYTAHGIQCGIRWSPAGIVDCVGVEAGDFFQDYSPMHTGLDMEIDNDQGRFLGVPDPNQPEDKVPQPMITIVLTEDGPIGSGTLFTYTFEAVANGKVTIDFDDYIESRPKPFNHIIVDYTDTGGIYKAVVVEPTLENGQVVVGQLPELIVEEVTGAWEEDEQSYTLTYTVTNQGVSEAAASTTAIYIDDEKVDSQECPALAADASDTVTAGPFTLSGDSDEIKICADEDEEIAEGDEDNNCAEYVISTLPDLAIEEVSQAWDVSGESYTITYTITNQGLSEAAASTTAIYIDDEEVDSQDCPALAVGDGDTVTAGPFTLSGSSDEIKICADKDNEVTEADEDNNCQQATWPVVGEEPDLVVTYLSQSWEAGGDSYTVTYTITNRGEGSAAASTTAVYIDEEEVENVECPALAAAASDTQTVGPFAMAGEEDVIRVCADKDNKVAEADENNNCLEKTLEIGESGKADLVVLSKSEYWVVEGDSYNVTYTVNNQGFSIAPASTTVILIDGEEVATKKCPALAAGESDTVTIGPSSLSEGEDLVTVCVDAEDEVDESNESNNCRERTWSISLAASIPATRPPTPGITIAWEYVIGLIGLVFIAGLAGYVLAIR